MIEILGQDKDKTGCLLTIKRSQRLAFSPAYATFVKQMAELIENGHAHNFATWSDDDCGIIWAECQTKICGIFCYNKERINEKLLFVQLTGVEKEYRKRGIHTILNKYFEQTANELGCHVTVATVSPANTVRLSSCEKDNLILKYLAMYKKI